MPHIDDFKTKLGEFKKIKYTPWDLSPEPENNQAPPNQPPPSPTLTNQNRAKTEPKPVQNRFNLSSKLVQSKTTILRKPDLNPIKTSLQSSSKTCSEPHLNSSPTDRNITSKNVPEALHFLTGSQKKIFFHLIDSCCSSKSLITSNINTTELSKLLGIPKDTVKTSLRRLREKSLINKIIYKQGVGGFLKFEIPENIKTLGLELQKNDLINRFKTGSQTGSQTGSVSHIVSSSINNTTTTCLPFAWDNIDYASLEHVGFNKSHLMQIYREYVQKPEVSLDVEMIQNSIYALAFDVKYNNALGSFKNSPAVVLTCLLKKGQPYSSKTPEKVLTPREEAMKEYILAQGQKNAKILEMESKSKELALQEWLYLLSEEELLDFNQEPRLEGIPDKIYQNSRRKKATEFAKDYFNTVIWPKKRQEIFDELKQQT